MLTKTLKSLLKLIIPIVLISSCKTYDNVYSSYDESVDFTKYKTYAWLNTRKSDSAGYYFNDIIENNAKNYIDNEFIKRGYTVELDSPDVFVELVLVNEKKEETVTNPYNCENYTYYNFPYNPIYNNNPYYGNQYYNNYNYYYEQQYHQPYVPSCDYSTCVTQKIEYIKGTITINVIDRELNKLVWTGSAEGDIYDPHYLQNEIHPAIKDILEQYPVHPSRGEGNPIVTF